MKAVFRRFQFLMVLSLAFLPGCALIIEESMEEVGHAEPSVGIDVMQDEDDVSAASSEASVCDTEDVHPVALSIAETFDVSYERIEEWFCSGYSFENIMIALETGQALEIDPDPLLDMLQEMNWEEIWLETGFLENE